MSILKKAGLPRQRFHDIRHAAASLMLAQGVNPRVVTDMLGHSQISLTLNSYSHVVPSLERDAAKLMDAVPGTAQFAARAKWSARILNCAYSLTQIEQVRKFSIAL